MCLPVSLPCKTLGVFGTGLLRVLAAADTCHSAGPGVGCLAAIYWPAAYMMGGLHDRRVEVLAFDAILFPLLGT